MPNQLRLGLKRYLNAEQLASLASARIGIAGAGGLGSNVALLLARSGIERLAIIDHDIIDASNLNRQHYWPEQIGQPKVEALAEHLKRLNPACKLHLLKQKITADTLGAILPLADIWVEALDDAKTKKFFVEGSLATGCRVAAASGIAGYGGLPMRIKHLGKSLVVVGDFQSDIQYMPPLAPRVAQAAAMLADVVLEFILGAV